MMGSVKELLLKADSGSLWESKAVGARVGDRELAAVAEAKSAGSDCLRAAVGEVERLVGVLTIVEKAGLAAARDSRCEVRNSVEWLLEEVMRECKGGNSGYDGVLGVGVALKSEEAAWDSEAGGEVRSEEGVPFSISKKLAERSRESLLPFSRRERGCLGR